MAPPQTIFLPDGQTFTVTPVFAGLFFKSNELNTHPTPFPIGWTVVLHTQDDSRSAVTSNHNHNHNSDDTDADMDDPYNFSTRRSHSPRPLLHSYTKPTLQGDSLFISSISNPSSSEYKPAASPTRQIAMMLWVTLYWYFHQPAPSPILPPTQQSEKTHQEGQPRGDWRIYIKRDGVLRGRNLIPKLERMGLITAEDTSVGETPDDATGWMRMFVSRQMFWQIPGRLFLFTLQPISKSNSSYPGSPVGSRPGSPAFSESRSPCHSPHFSSSSNSHLLTASDLPGAPPPTSIMSPTSFPIGPFYSSSHLPTYYPPGPLHYITTNNVRHPKRPKPPRMGENFYSRFIPSVGQYLSFRVASSSPRPVPYLGPVGPHPPEGHNHLFTLPDTSLLQMWMSSARVQRFWGEYVPDFLGSALRSTHSFPVIGMWDGVPFGYFEIYWVKEDVLGRHVPNAVTDFDRGLHVFIGEEWARGRVQSWVSSLAHYMFASDYRTMSVCCEPRVDNKRFIQHLELAGLNKQCEVTFPHKQSWFGKLDRENWQGPAL